MGGNIRQQALQSIAALSAKSSSSFDLSDLDKLCRAVSKYGSGRNGCDLHDVGRIPMTLGEYDVVLALCKAAPSLQTAQNAQRLARHLVSYLLDSHVQLFGPSPFFRHVEPCPAESLGFHVTTALLCLGIRHGDVQEMVSDNIWAFLSACLQATQTTAANDKDGPGELDDAIRTTTMTVALVGFLDAASAQADFWRTGGRLALVQLLRDLLSQSFLVSVEAAISTVRNAHAHERHVKEWKRNIGRYEDMGRPLGAMLLQRSFMWLLVAATSLLVAEPEALRSQHILDLHMAGRGLPRRAAARSSEADLHSVEVFATVAIGQMHYLETSADFDSLCPDKARLASAVKGAVLMTFVNLTSLNEEAADVERLRVWLEDTLHDLGSMCDEELATVVLKSLAVACRLSADYAPIVSRLLPRFIVESGAQRSIILTASKCLVFVLQMLPQDVVITTLYRLGNVLSSSHAPNPDGIDGEAGYDAKHDAAYEDRLSSGSSLSFRFVGEEETARTHGNAVLAICEIASTYEDEKTTGLAQSMLAQKLIRANGFVNGCIIHGAGVLAVHGGQAELRNVLKRYNAMTREAVVENRQDVLVAVTRARNYIAAKLRRGSALYDIFLEHLLDSIISRGDAHSGQCKHAKDSDIEVAAGEIEQLVPALAVFMSAHDFNADEAIDDDTHALLRDAWLNIVVHGLGAWTARGKQLVNELRVIAIHSPPLVLEKRGEQDESDIELNPVLRRAKTNEREWLHRKQLSDLMPARASEIKGLSCCHIIFLQAAYLVESLRADAGDCSKALSYFLEPSMRRGNVGGVMDGIMDAVMAQYVRKMQAAQGPALSAQHAADQLAIVFCSCCHRIERVQQAAFGCADCIIQTLPSSMCQRKSLFALLELLSLMWTSCLEAETDRYEPRTTFKSGLGGVEIHLSDDYRLRHVTLQNLQKKAKTWLTGAVNMAPADVKALLQTYLADHDDDGACGHMCLGRSFAVELGTVIPWTDQRLSSLDGLRDSPINTASDFMRQYTIRQEYRYAEPPPDQGLAWPGLLRLDRRAFVFAGSSSDATTALAQIEQRILARQHTPLADVRASLRRAAALLCRSARDECAAARYLVSIPFALFTKASMKLGLSLWLAVMHEKPRMQPRILAEIAQQFESSIHNKTGLFSPVLTSPDPFFVKAEFAPSDQQWIEKRKHQVENLLAPHTLLMQFLQSHYNATRLGSPDTQRIFVRLLQLMLDEVGHASVHPMARALHFQIVLFGLGVVTTSPSLGEIAQSNLMHKILSAALSWFKATPRWSFGSNILQLKTELRLMADLVAALETISSDALGKIESLAAKEKLLTVLLETEQDRLLVWAFPTGANIRIGNKNMLEATIVPLVRTAWEENPSLAMELATRFPLAKVKHELRRLLLSFPDKAVSDPNAVPLLLVGERDGALPPDVSFQLKYLLFWAPLNPITAVTLCMPQFRHHPYIIQYAMRALESHSVDVTFFYVPQLVQTLRYDALGYVERYIVETAQSSQLFAHQIIWNMKANAFKDNDATMPDPLKPTLDKVMARMIGSFSATDRDFFEREFAFFNEVTGISGKLKPLIGKSKPEKKQKIEEELRKIKVEKGVYLPSNPDGLVIGIDRQSGKPLQSHAKAPYMATFRIKKNRSAEDEADEMLEDEPGKGKAAQQDTVVEVWQSAIFKVGDDCRQDVLALQMIAAFRSIFHSVGLDVFVYPYRVTATAPGCGVIDVLPNSISRDMLGREAVNGLYDYFVSKYGNENSRRFQHARLNFVKSMAAYSVISFLLQFKDRHNGNIMIDDAGHVLHIDFGFCFDIAPGGIKFERAPFKLTSEMLTVMGGSPDHQAFKWFEELSVKAFLASRPHADKLGQIVLLMMDSGLPCFRPESVAHFRDRFVLDRGEREAADFMRDLIKKSNASYSTGLYDQYQLLTNGIPY